MNDLLSLLSFDDYVSGEVLSTHLGITRAAIWKRIEAMRANGIAIEGSGKKGYRLLYDENSIAPMYWQHALETKALGQVAIYENEMTSTNTLLKAAALNGAAHGTVALCETQTNGRGRLDRVWEKGAAQAQLCLSVLVRPHMETEKAPLFTLVAGLSMAQALESLGLSPHIKWPNDLVISGKKICGILVEMAADMDGISHIIIGSGVNISEGSYPPSLDDKATYLNAYTKANLTRQKVLLAYLKVLEHNLTVFETDGFTALKKAYEARLITLNSPVLVSGMQTISGIARSLDDSGALMVEDENGELQRIMYGDVSVRGVMGYV